MKYLFRAIAILPALSVGVSAVLALIVTFSYKIALPLCIANLYAFGILLHYNEEIVKSLVNWIKVLCNKTIIYDI